jgi:uncharacterized repeat protein (TIGR01451 family)
MKTRAPLPVAILALALFLVSSPVRSAAAPPGDAVAGNDVEAARRAFGELPLRFEANAGHMDGRVRFVARGSRSSLFLTPGEAVIALGEGAAPAALRLRFAGADPAAEMVGEGALAGTSNYFVGEPASWRTGVPGFEAVRYRGVYPGVDLVFYGNQRQLEYDLVVAPGADVRAIRLAFEGADRLEIDERGDLVLHTPAGELRQHAPAVLQVVEDERRPVAARYVLLGGGEVGFAVGPYDPSRPLVVDPVLGYSTFLGGGFSEAAWSMAVDDSGAVYVTGETGSLDFPLARPLDTTPNGVFVTKLSPSGNELVFSTYLGGSGAEVARSIAVDSGYAVYVAGDTTSPDFPTVRALDGSHNGESDAFVLKLAPAGDALEFSTFLGGSLSERGAALTVDHDGAAYVAGTTYSADFPTAAAYDATFNGEDFDAYVAKLSRNGEALVYSTFLGGTSFDEANGIDVDAAGAAYVVGYTWSADFPLVNPFDATIGASEAFVTKLSASGDALVYSSYLGGDVDGDVAAAVAVDGSGAAYVTGNTSADDFPVANAFDSTHSPGAADVFVSKVQPDGGALVYSTYLGGLSGEFGRAIDVDASGSAWVAGYTGSSLDFPVVSAFDDSYNGGEFDVFLTKFSPDGATLEKSSFLGGSSADFAFDVAVDKAGSAYLTGRTESVDFPTVNAYDSTLSEPFSDAFVAKLVSSADLSVAKTASPSPVGTGGRLTFTVTVTNLGPDAAEGVVVQEGMPAGTAFVSASCSQGVVATPLPGGGGDIACTLGTLEPSSSATVTLVVDVTAPPGATITNTATATSTASDPDPTNNSASATVAVGEACAIVCPQPIWVGSGAGNTACGAFVEYPEPATTGECGPVLCTPASGSFFGMGTTTVTCTAASGASCSFTVTVDDQTPPALACAPDQTASATSELGAIVLYQAPSVSDNCSPAGVVCSPASGSLFPVGVTTVACVAVDAAGNESTCSFTVTVTRPRGTDTVGVFLPGPSQWLLRNSNSGGAAHLTFGFGPQGAGWVPLSGDWDGDGDDTPGFYDPVGGVFYLRNVPAAGAADLAFGFGPRNSAFRPLVGDWDGDGVDSVGLYDPATSRFFLKNANGPGVADLVFVYGSPAADRQPLAGDWDGDGRDSVGLYTSTSRAFFLRNGNSAGAADYMFTFGPPNATAVVGDWDGDGRDTIGVYLPATAAWFLKNENSAGSASLTFTYGPANVTPVVGDWDGL